MSVSDLKIIVNAQQLEEISGGDAPLTHYDQEESCAWTLHPKCHKYLVKILSGFGEVSFEAGISIIEDAYDTYFVNDTQILLIKHKQEYMIEISATNLNEQLEVQNVIGIMLNKKFATTSK